MRHKHSLTWNMARNTQKRGKLEIHTLGPGIWHYTVKNVKNKKYTQYTWIMARKLTNVANEAQTLYDLEDGEKH